MSGSGRRIHAGRGLGEPQGDRSAIAVAASLVRGAFLPQSGRVAQREIVRLEEAMKLAGAHVKDHVVHLRRVAAQLREQRDAARAEAAELRAKVERLSAALDDLGAA